MSSVKEVDVTEAPKTWEEVIEFDLDGFTDEEL